MQEGNAPINDGKYCMQRHISERETKHSSSNWEPGEVKLQSSASVVASLLFQSAGSLASVRGDSQLGTCPPHPLSLFNLWSGRGKASHMILEPNRAGTAVVS